MEPKLLDDALGIAGRYAQRARLPAEDAEDCAAHFAVRMLTASPSDPDTEAWLRRCARNHVIDYVRALRRGQAHVCPWPQVGEGDDAAAAEYANDEPGSDAGLMREECRRHLMAVLAKLDPIPQQIFLRHYLEGKTAQDLAAAFDRSPHAVEQCLTRSRQRLRAALERQGLTEADLRQYLAAPPPPFCAGITPTAMQEVDRPQAANIFFKIGREVLYAPGVISIVGRIQPCHPPARGYRLWSLNRTRTRRRMSGAASPASPQARLPFSA